MRGKHLEGSMERLVFRIACSGYKGKSNDDASLSKDETATIQASSMNTGNITLDYGK